MVSNNSLPVGQSFAQSANQRRVNLAQEFPPNSAETTSTTSTSTRNVGIGTSGNGAVADSSAAPATNLGDVFSSIFGFVSRIFGGNPQVQPPPVVINNPGYPGFPPPGFLPPGYPGPPPYNPGGYQPPSQPYQPYQPYPQPPTYQQPYPPYQPQPYPPAPVIIPPYGRTVKVWGDPHFEGLFHGAVETEKTGDLNGNGKIGDTVTQKYDFQGADGQTLNVLSDSGVQVNGTIGKFGGAGATVFKQIGVSIQGADGRVYRLKTESDDNKPPVLVSQDGTEVALKNGEAVSLGSADSTATWNQAAKRLDITTREYNLGVTQAGGYLDLSAKINQGFDGRNNDGILGISGNLNVIGGKVQNGKEGAGAQGEGVATKNEQGVGADRTKEQYVVQGGLFAMPTQFNTFSSR